MFGLLIAKPFSMILRFFPPLVTGTVITVIGLSLIGADVSLIAGNVATDQAAVLLAIAIGTLIAWPMRLDDFSTVASSGWFGIARPFHFGPPKSGEEPAGAAPRADAAAAPERAGPAE